ncbi:MAG: YcxB family protein [Bacteroidota bacterium]
MIVKTKKYKLDTNKYIKLGMKNIVRQQWWVFLIALAIASGTFFIPTTIWFILGALIALVLYFLFWLIQFAGVTQLEQGKMLFEKLSYEIDSRQVMIKVSSKQGMPIKWEQIKKAYMMKDHFLLTVSKAQLIHLPFKIFNSNHEIKFLETVLRRKGYIK